MCCAPATVVDHIIAHRGDMTLFWDKANWQPLCKSCHNREKQRQEFG
ncbi:HNH endonuclease signature motif containing protein [Alloyangia pacifica]|nr:HNH endonuclease signature motif containing protein [Alloyangia pacifica]MCA0996301.1 HNH endonuclease [Alloyangia pacifica]